MMCKNVAATWNYGLSLWERETLCTLAQLPGLNAAKMFEDLSDKEATAILFAFRRGVALGASCSAALLQDSLAQGTRA